MARPDHSPPLSRRAFLATAAGLAAALRVPPPIMAAQLAEPAAPAGPDAPTTLRETIRQRATGTRGYRTLASGPGEPYVVRADILGHSPAPGRAAARRSLAYLGHTSDIHIIDAQSPARLEPVNQYSTTLIPGSFRPQETMSVHVQAAMVAALANVSLSPLTGAPMAAVINKALAATRQHLGLFTAWTLAMLVAILAGQMLQTGLVLLVALVLAFLPLAVMDGRANALAANFAALADRPLRWAGTAIIVAIGGVLWWLLAAVNVFFVKGTLASAIAWVVGGVLVWWLGVAWACLYRSTRTGAARPQ